MRAEPNPAVEHCFADDQQWSAEMRALRAVVLDAGVSEELKWRKACYTSKDANIAIMQPMKEHLAFMFFKGALLEDPAGILVDQGPNSRSAKRIEFTSVADVDRLADFVGDYLAEAVEVEEAGTELPRAPDLVLVAELQERLEEDPELREAFEDLTPGRQREYNLHISSAKQASTRYSRVEKYAPKIMAGKGFRDR